MRVLIADDDPISLKLLQRTLESWGYEVTAVADGEAAWACFEEFDFPLVVTDWVMPRTDGLELVRRIRAYPRPGYVFVILLAAATRRSEVAEGIRAGADDFVSKPFDREELRARLRSGERIIRLEQTLTEQNRQLRAQNAEMQADLRMAREVQRALLPQDYPRFPEGAPEARSLLRFYDRYCPVGEVGGDFFDVLALGDTLAAVVIADVMGHGVRAALVTAMMRTLTEGLHALADDPGALLGEMNRELSSIFGKATVPVFLTAFVATIDALTGTVRFANAGHPVPLLLDRVTAAVTALESPGGAPGPPLGVDQAATYAVGIATLPPEGLMLLYTDGLTEQADARLEEFGEDRLKSALRGWAALPMPALLDGVLSEVRTFAGRATFADDICLLAVERRDGRDGRSGADADPGA